MATKMALNLGLGSDVAQTSSERERAMHRITWNSVAQLQQLTASSMSFTLGLAIPGYQFNVADHQFHRFLVQGPSGPVGR